MIAQRPDALWVGWGGTTVFLACWLMISRISAFFIPDVGRADVIRRNNVFLRGRFCRNKWIFSSLVLLR